MLLLIIKVLYLLILMYIKDLKWWLRVGRKYNNHFPRLFKYEATRRACVDAVVTKAVIAHSLTITKSTAFKSQASYHQKPLHKELLAFSELGYKIAITKTLYRIFRLKEHPLTQTSEYL